jgi:hypothetical protein
LPAFEVAAETNSGAVFFFIVSGCIVVDRELFAEGHRPHLARHKVSQSRQRETRRIRKRRVVTVWNAMVKRPPTAAMDVRHVGSQLWLTLLA